jgi:hypothetical protein
MNTRNSLLLLALLAGAACGDSVSSDDDNIMDTLAPTVPGNFAVTSVDETVLSTGWTSSTDNVGVAGYRLYKDNVQAGTTTSVTFDFSGLVCGTAYALDVEAYDAAGNTSPRSSLTASTAACDVAFDGFERPSLGSDWTVVFPGAPNDQVRILDSSDLGMGPGAQGFFLVNWTRRAFSADQFCEATLPTDATPGWIYMVHVRWRATDGARYGFAYNGDPGQSTYGSWIFKYDGVPTVQTRVFASTPATVTPQPGDTLRVEIVGYTLRGYLNGTLVLEATDTDASKISSGVPGLAARWATGNTSTNINIKVWESWSGGSM